jgi:hypothetical protein
MLPLTCRTPIDKNGEHARRCFNYDILVRNATLLYLAYIGREPQSIKLFIDDIATRANRYGLISMEEKNEISHRGIANRKAVEIIRSL